MVFVIKAIDDWMGIQQKKMMTISIHAVDSCRRFIRLLRSSITQADHFTQTIQTNEWQLNPLGKK